MLDFGQERRLVHYGESGLCTDSQENIKIWHENYICINMNSEKILINYPIQ